MGRPKRLKISIVGGSIIGVMAGILLSRAGHDVTIYERSKQGLVGRGGGVTTSAKVLEQMKTAGLLDEDFPSIGYSELHLTKVTESKRRFGRCPLCIPLDMRCVNWSGMWENMRKRIPDGIYHNNKQVMAAKETDGQAVLGFTDGTTQYSNLVLFADGYNSFGRGVMFPGVGLTYRGYTVWRGVVSERDIDQVAQLAIHPRISLKIQQGSFISYMIPNREGSDAPGDRQFNWACYFPLAQEELTNFMTDKDGKARTGSIPAGYMRPDQDIALKQMIRENLPEYYADVVCRSSNNQIQQIYTSEVPAYAKGRMCLAGDAGAMVPPLTGAGVFKGFTNARDLVKGLERDVSLDDILTDWSRDQTGIANSILTMGDDMEKAFIWNTIDLGTAAQKACVTWFERSVRVSKEYSFFAA